MVKIDKFRGEYMEKQMKLYNLDKIVKIEVYPKSEAPFIFKNKKKNFLGFIKQKEGFYPDMLTYSDEPYSQKDLREGRINDIEFLVEDKKVYFKPYVNIIFENEIIKNIEFETYSEALILLEDIKKQLPSNVNLIEFNGGGFVLDKK